MEVFNLIHIIVLVIVAVQTITILEMEARYIGIVSVVVVVDIAKLKFISKAYPPSLDLLQLSMNLRPEYILQSSLL
jgi:hypothetical protein